MDIRAFKKEVIRCLANDAEEGTNYKSEQNGPQHKKQRIHCFKKNGEEINIKYEGFAKIVDKKINELHVRKYATNCTFKLTLM